MATRPPFRFKFESSEIRKSLWALKCISSWSRKTSAAQLAFTELLRVQLPVQPDDVREVRISADINREGTLAV